MKKKKFLQHVERQYVPVKIESLMTSQYLYINILTVDFHGLQEDMVCI